MLFVKNIVFFFHDYNKKQPLGCFLLCLPWTGDQKIKNHRMVVFCFENHSLGADLLSPNGLPSALAGLTAEFGMGSGGPPPLEAPRQ